MAMLEAFTSAAELGMNEHDRVLLARQQLVAARPVVSANLIAKKQCHSAGPRHLAVQLRLR